MNAIWSRSEGKARGWGGERDKGEESEGTCRVSLCLVLWWFKVLDGTRKECRGDAKVPEGVELMC